MAEIPGPLHAQRPRRRAEGIPGDGGLDRTVFAQPDREHIEKQFREVATMLCRSHSKVAGMLEDSQTHPLAFAAFPRRHWRQTWSTNPLEQVNKEIKRRTDVVGVFPNAAALMRLAGSVLIEQHDEWEAANAATSPNHPCSS